MTKVLLLAKASWFMPAAEMIPSSIAHKRVPWTEWGVCVSVVGPSCLQCTSKFSILCDACFSNGGHPHTFCGFPLGKPKSLVIHSLLTAPSLSSILSYFNT